ncbi:MAG: replication initiation protein [Clostridiales bacterium]|nr:replication initiation protein [Clostridiales bacterium]
MRPCLGLPVVTFSEQVRTVALKLDGMMKPYLLQLKERFTQIELERLELKTDQSLFSREVNYALQA